MNILHISPYVPSVHAAYAGGVCMGKEVETLRKKHNVFVLSFVNDEKEEQLIDKEYKDDTKCYFVKSNTYTKATNALLNLNMPIFFAIRNSSEFKKKLIKIIEEERIDVIHAEYTAMGQFVWVKDKFPNIKFNLVEHDVTKQSYDRYVKDSTGFKRIYNKWQANLVEKYEGNCLKKCDEVFTLNTKDLDLLKKYYSIKDAKVITPYYGVDFSNVNKNIKKVPKTICFVGQMARTENHDAAMRLINIVSKLNRKDIKINIIGAYPSQELQNLESENIHVTGFVDSIEDEIMKNDIAVFPLMLGAGIKFKILLAAGLGLPVITTSVGAEGIDAEGKYLLLGQSDEELSNLILKLVDDEELKNEVASNLQKYVLDNFNWEKSVALFDEIYK